MKLYIIESSTFVKMADNNLLCIGSTTEVDNKDEAQIAALVFKALAWRQFTTITKSPKTLQ